MDKVEELLARGVANIIPNKKSLEELLKSGKKLKIYNGADPTATRLHLGHAVPLRKLQKFTELGHEVFFLIGDFTALIGDNSDKDTERPALTPDQVKENFRTYKQQASKILDFDKVKVVFNSEWLNKLSFGDVIKLSQYFSVNDFLGRELIRKRLDERKRVGLHEFLYPIAQGYDHYHLNADLQIGGTEQIFNMQAGRTLLKILTEKESFLMTFDTLEGTDGRKMSKSWGNAIWLEDSSADMFAKVMAIKDELIVPYFILATDVSFDEVKNIKSKLENGENPMGFKKQLATQIVTELYDKDEAESAAQSFRKTVQEKAIPEDIKTRTFTSTATITDILLESEISSSKSDAKRLIEQGGVAIDDKIITDPNAPAQEGIIRAGKRRFVNIKIE
ncbi:MAG: tyrosine--tRNA ligase [Patescibacteria group bacterium]|nr:tyrosine--tRNA ligase [Patescibacteria group bacterium]